MPIRSSLRAAAFTALMASFMISSAHAAPAAGDAARGALIFKSRCAMCHSLDSNKIGPALKGVYGRKAGTAPGFNYSAVLKASGIVWDAKTLDEWLAGPSNMEHGTKMTFNVPDAKDRADVIAYLKSVSAK